VEPSTTQEYTFTLGIDDGARLWIDGQLIIDQWIPQGYTEHSGAITLAAGQRVPIVVEYFENEGAEAVNLFWESASQPREIVPQARLFAYSDLPPATATLTFTRQQHADAHVHGDSDQHADTDIHRDSDGHC
jgi:hypothetical protein